MSVTVTLLSDGEKALAQTYINMGLAGLELAMKGDRSKAILKMSIPALIEMSGNDDLMTTKIPTEIQERLDHAGEEGFAPVSLETILAAIPSDESAWMTNQLVIGVLLSLKYGLAAALEFNNKCVAVDLPTTVIDQKVEPLSFTSFVDNMKPEEIIFLAHQFAESFRNGTLSIKWSPDKGIQCVKAA